uniref:Si:dkey-119f1.1 n=1 Tax=Fundulus heteroclitus TaxID=8078 RepID=A0A3Q2Q5H1_FUNHE
QTPCLTLRPHHKLPKRVKKISQFQGPSDVVSDAGVVQSITLKNFMCHSLLGPFAFGSNVNFVVGNNGSGKSAILTALIVALGGNAMATNRGSSLKGFVKEGESSADVSITLHNKGKDAYKLDVYGPSITIDLRITREGLRTYKLRSKTGKDRRDFISFFFRLLCFCVFLHVNNPISVLTQEMSKYFLHSKGEGDKYKFFMKATQLSQMKEDFIHIKATKEVTEQKLENHGEYLKDLRCIYLERKERYKSLASLREMQTKLEELQKQMAWALVAELEKDLKPVKERLQEEGRSTVKYDEKVEEWQNKVKQAEEKYKEIQEQLERITQQVQELQPKCSELKAEAQKRNSLLKSCELTVHRCRNNLRDLEKDKAQLSARIKDLTLNITQTTGAESQARAKHMEQIETELENLNLQISTLGQQIDQFQHACRRAKEEQGKMIKEYDELKKYVEASKRKLQTMESSRTNRLRRFGELMPSLLEAIEEADRKGQFQRKPRGPLGYLIGLKDPELALAVEVCLKTLLLAFTCDNYKDEKVLKAIIGRVYRNNRRPAIITSPFLPDVHNTSGRGVNHPQYPSVLQALIIKDPVVANCLIDQRNIESILLIKNRAEARRIMQGKNPPANCFQAFTKDGDQIFTNRNYSSDQNRPNYLSGDVEEEIRSTSRWNWIFLQFHQHREHNWYLFRSAHTKNKATKLQLELTDLRNVEEPQSEDLRMANLKADYEKADQEYKQHKESISTITDEADSVKVMLSLRSCISSNSIFASCRCWRQLTSDKNQCKRLECKRKETAHTHTSLFPNGVPLFSTQASVAKASEIWPERLEVSRTAKSIDGEINRLKIKIASQQEQQGDREEIVRQYQEALEKYKNVSQQMRSLNSFIRKVEKVITFRLQVYTELRIFSLYSRCKYYFNTMLAQRGYSGCMKFDHKNETLTISVQPGQGNQADLSDMRSLSGGERSFSTVCFVLSLWAITESPFRCLDEFDVYMDMVNRRISMDMMLKVAAIQFLYKLKSVTAPARFMLISCLINHLRQAKFLRCDISVKLFRFC